MPEFTISIEADGLTDPRVEELEDLYEALCAEPELLGPAVGGNLRTGAVDVIVTVEADSQEEAQRRGAELFAKALIATGRAVSVARVAAAAA